MSSLMSLLVLLVTLGLATTTATATTPGYPVLEHDYVNDLTPYDQLRGTPYNVSFNGRAIAINGANTLLLSGSIHYPRSTPDMWPVLMDYARRGGLNMVQVYLFWNYHEWEYRHYDFHSDSRNLAKFIQAAGDAGLFVNLRIGPFVCSEWTLGGIPQWLREMARSQSMPFRTNNTLWESEMETIVRYIYKYIEPYLAKNGGPIILMQVENEYDNMEGNDPGNRAYVQWMGELTQRIDSSATWIMCLSHDAPSYIINTCNGWYCDQWIAQHQKNYPNQPPMYTEDWSGWFYQWGAARMIRPSEDLSFAVARWFALGGAHHNFYMYHAGTQFGRYAGGPQDVTDYHYDAPLDEYGYPNEPKYSHTTALHHVLTQNSKYLLGNSIAKTQSLGPQAEAHVYGALNNSGIFFLSNIDEVSDWTGEFNGQSWTVPPWSTTLVDASDNRILFNTATLSPILSAPRPMTVASASADPATIEYIEEPIGIYNTSAAIVVTKPQEQLHVTRDETDFLWHVTNVTVTKQMIGNGSMSLSLSNVNELVYVFFNEQRVIVGEGVNVNTVTYSISVKGLGPGIYPLQILVLTMGSVNCCGAMERFTRGIEGAVLVNGLDITNNGWTLLPYLQGERRSYFDSTSGTWSTGPHLGQPLTWYRLTLPTPKPVNTSLASWQLDLIGMWKGQAWINGHHLGRYWLIAATQSICSNFCDYRGLYDASKCRTGCGEPSQRFYHVPRNWLNPVGVANFVVVFEERGGDPATIALLQRN